MIFAVIIGMGLAVFFNRYVFLERACRSRWGAMHGIFSASPCPAC